MDAKFWRAGMPSLRSKQRSNQYICLGVSTLLLSSAFLVGCGSGESEARYEPTPPEVITPKPKNLDIKVPVEMRDVVVKVIDNFDNSLVIEQNVSTTSNLNITLPKVLNTEHLYRIEISTTPNSLIYDFLSGQYKSFSLTFNALVEVNTSNLTQPIFVTPNSEAAYQRAIIRSGQLPTDTPDSTQISALQLKLATSDVNVALLNGFSNIDLPNLSPTTILSIFKSNNLTPSNFNRYINTYLNFGYIQQWATAYPDDNAFVGFTKNLAIDLKDGYLDAKKIRGDATPLVSLITQSPDNTDPNKNTLINIAANQKNIRDQYATLLKSAVLKLANNYDQPNANPSGYMLLEQKVYSGTDPKIEAFDNFRIGGAGDYRRAVGFAVNSNTSTCLGSTYLCQSGVTGINSTFNANLPSIEYLIGHYEDKINNCQLNIRANGVLELRKGTQIFTSKLDGDSTDNLMLVNQTGQDYLLNSSSTDVDFSLQKYKFIQIKLNGHQVLSASAGLDTRKAPDQLQTTELECSFI